MYLTCIAKELLAHMRSMRYLMAFALFLVLTLSATVVRTELYRKQKADHQKAVQERYRTMEMVERFWQSRGLGATVEAPPNPLAIFCSGLENELTRSFSISEWMVPTTGMRKLSNPSFQYFLNLDFMLIVNIVCSLLALLLTFDAVCGEREQGTLKVLLSGPLPRDVIIVSKIAAALLTMLIPLVLSWVVSMVYVLVVARVALGPEQLARLFWIALISLVYVGFFLALGTAVSCWVQRRATALAICLFCWIFFVLAVPNLVPMAVKRFAPIPPQSKIVLEKDAVDRYINKEIMPRIREELSASGEYNDIDALMAEVWRRRHIEYNKRVAKIDRFYNNKIGRQLALNQQLSRISPSASFTYAATYLGGTGIQDFRRILSDVQQYQWEFLERQDEQERARKQKEQELKAQGKLPRREELIDRYDPGLWPEFSPRKISLSSRLNESWPDIVLLVGGCVLLLLGGFVGFMRYDPR